MENSIDGKYKNLLEDILENGNVKNTRNGKTLSVFGRSIRHNMSEGFPAITTKKLAFKTMVTELLWFMRGSTNIKYLVDNNCHIWDGDCYKAYCKIARSVEEPDYDIHVDDPMQNCTRLMTQKEFINKIKINDEFAKEYGELGPIYGYQWRNWNGSIDQLQNLINDTVKNPDSRRLTVSAWNPSDIKNQTLPPCHDRFQVYTRELSYEERMQILMEKTSGKYNAGNESDNPLAQYNIPDRAVSLSFNMRSNDVPLGLPFNIASYGLLLEIIGRMVNMKPDELIANLGDAHIYENQIKGVKKQLTRNAFELPNLIIPENINFGGSIDDFLNSCDRDSFKLEGYKSHPSIEMPLSN